MSYPSFSRAPVTYALIAANLFVSVIAFASTTVFVWLMFNVGAVRDGEIWRIITSGFLHGGVMHLLFNMFTLYFFGPVLERRQTLGKQGYLVVYFVSLVGGSLWALYVNFGDLRYSAIGASGAVSGIMVAVSMFAPFSRIIMIFGIIPVPAILFTVFFVLFSAFAIGLDDSLIGHEAHLGGAIAGFITTTLLKPTALSGLISKLSGLFSKR